MCQAMLKILEYSSDLNKVQYAQASKQDSTNMLGGKCREGQKLMVSVILERVVISLSEEGIYLG